MKAMKIDALRRQADQRRGVRVGADRVEAAAEGEVARSELEDHDDGEGEHEQRPDLEVADGDEVQRRQVDQPGGQAVGGDGLGSREIDEDAAVDGQRAEGDDDRRHPPPGDENAVDHAHEGAERDRRSRTATNGSRSLLAATMVPTK